ncbi:MULTISPECIES: GNAT family N-acetyltransferase [Bacillaceae]|uniref:GNAT family N-acetyltransferase n=1 Tax=Evansella alkalicola TaxID=745819 RepID=A0ABS6JWE5_9BACI|nr:MULTISPECIES: GNAT family N-acetyltransferase [Bacillaceae]MBU9722918.1 GNAT family N-acetyltransferase [Bacillus alkalicola]
MGENIIRPAKLGDEQQIGTVHVKSWQEAYKGIISPTFLSSLSIEERTNMWKRSLSRPSKEHGVYVVEDADGHIVGFATGGPNRSKDKFPQYEGELYAIYLLKEVWGNGLGEQLTAAVTTHLKNVHGFDSMIVMVLADNPAKKFYERMGGKVVGQETITIDEQAYEELVLGFKI